MKKAMVCVFAVIGGLSLLAMGLSDELTATGADKKGLSAGPYALFLHTDGDWRIKGDSGEVNLGTVADPVDHGATTGLADDDHTQYLNVARHGIGAAHVSGFNNTLPISGDANGKTTQGAHNADGEVHYPRPAQTLTVGTADGQYATIAAALAVANGAAGPTTPYEIAIYPGIYQENNLTVADYVSLRAVIPWQSSIADSSANPILIIAAECFLDGVIVSASGAGPGIQFTSAATGNVYLDRVSVISNTGSALDFNATTQDINIDNGSRISSQAGPLISGKTAICRIVARNTEFNYGGSSAISSVIDIDASQAISAGADLFDSCQFYADNLIGGTTPASFIDWDANVLWLRNCQFALGVNTAKTLNGILAQSGTVSVQGCKFDWVLTAGTPYDFNAAGGAAIQHAATVYDVDKTTGAGAISALPEGAALFDAVTMTGALLMGASDSPLLNLTPSGTGNSDIIKITPSGAIAGANAWRGLYILGDALDPAAAGATVFGGHIDLSDVSQANDPNLCGLLIEMPAVATTSGDFHAMKLTGNGQELILLNKDFVIDFTATSGGVLQSIFSDSATNTIQNSGVFKHLTSADMVPGFGASICLHIEDDASGDQTIARWQAYRGAFDNDGVVELGGGLDGNEFFLKYNGNAGGVQLPLALTAGTGLFFGRGNTEMYEDVLGFVLDDAGKDPLIIGDTVAIKLGDAAGAESLSILDSASNEVARINSNGQGLFTKLTHPTDTDTSILFAFNIQIFDAGGVELLKLDETNDQIVLNGDEEDIDTLIKWDGGTAIGVDGASGQVTMPEKLTVGSAVAAEILVVSDGTNRVARGYDGAPHDKVFGDSQFQVLAGDTDSGMALVVKGNGVGIGWLRSITSDGTKFVQMFHDGIRGVIDSNSGPIRMNDDTELQGGVLYNDTFWEDLRVSLATAKVGVSNPPDFIQFADNGAGSTGVFAFAFDPTTEEEVFFTAQLPHGYEEGTDIGAHVHWSPNGTGAAGQFVRWGLEYTWQNIDGTFANTTIATSDASAAGTATTSGNGTMVDAKHYVTEIETIDGTGMAISSILVCRLFRDATDGDDDYPNDAYGFEVDFHYEIDAPGSAESDHTKF